MVFGGPYFLGALSLKGKVRKYLSLEKHIKALILNKSEMPRTCVWSVRKCSLKRKRKKLWQTFEGRYRKNKKIEMYLKS
jgi:hypothetical protein